MSQIGTYWKITVELILGGIHVSSGRKGRPAQNQRNVVTQAQVPGIITMA